MNATTKAEADVLEVWRPISGYSGLYSVSSFGRVRSEAKNVIRRNGVVCHMPQKIMRPASGATKYLSLGLVNASGERRTHYVHTLVLEHFDAPRPNGMEACHCDGDRQHNAIANLRWDTRSGNHADKKQHGTATIGESHPMRKLTDEKVMDMRKKRAAGASVTQLANEFNVSRMTAHRAATGRSWSHIT
jgi:hypothetical protein